jgi:hypothetical protein
LPSLEEKENVMTEQKRLPGLIAAAFVLAAASTFAGDTGRCYRADVETAIVLPDNSEHPPGTLKICTTLRLSPVSGLHEVSIDGRTVGLFASRIRRSETSVNPTAAVFAFTRDCEDRLVLQGMGASDGDRSNSYFLRPQTDRQVLTAWLEPESNDARDLDGPTILISASR